MTVFHCSCITLHPNQQYIRAPSSPNSNFANICYFSGFWIMANLMDVAEKALAPHSSTFAWKLPRTEEPDRLQSMGSRRVGHDSGTSLSLSTFVHWRKKWQPTPIFLPGESQGRGSLVGCRLWGHTE